MLDQPDAAECLEAEHQLACHRRNAVVVEATLPAVGKCQATALLNQRAGVAFDLPQALAEPHRGQLQRATSEGVPVDGYFPRSAQDKFEWMDGFGNRLGLIYVDFDTLERIPKLSAEWFREAARQNAVV